MVWIKIRASASRREKRASKTFGQKKSASILVLKEKKMSATIRGIQFVVQPQTVMEGAGVKLKRSFPTRSLDYPDPFLLFDHFGSDDPADYLAGFPMHPHRGIETVTYMLAGVVSHRDSIGNAGKITAGDVQWMTSGRGILHEEMPEPDEGKKMEGFQLWVNLPASLKMTTPHYQEINSSGIPVTESLDGARIRVIAGSVAGHRGPVEGIAADPEYLDVSLEAGKTFLHEVDQDHTVLVYLYRGKALIGSDHTTEDRAIDSPAMIVLSEGDLVKIMAKDGFARFLVMSGKPMHEPIFRYGPFVMNTREEIEQTLRELRDGTFIRS
jgi:quercetin 2,3-dioxygenase